MMLRLRMLRCRYSLPRLVLRMRDARSGMLRERRMLISVIR